MAQQVGNLRFGKQQQGAQIFAAGGVKVERGLVVVEQRFVNILHRHLVALNLGEQLLRQPVEVGRAAWVILGAGAVNNGQQAISNQQYQPPQRTLYQPLTPHSRLARLRAQPAKSTHCQLIAIHWFFPHVFVTLRCWLKPSTA